MIAFSTLPVAFFLLHTFSQASCYFLPTINEKKWKLLFEFLFLFWQVESLALQYIFTFISARQLLGLNALTLVVVGSQEVFGVWEKSSVLSRKSSAGLKELRKVVQYVIGSVWWLPFFQTIFWFKMQQWEIEQLRIFFCELNNLDISYHISQQHLFPWKMSRFLLS